MGVVLAGSDVPVVLVVLFAVGCSLGSIIVSATTVCSTALSEARGGGNFLVLYLCEINLVEDQRTRLERSIYHQLNVKLVIVYLQKQRITRLWNCSFISFCTCFVFPFHLEQESPPS